MEPATSRRGDRVTARWAGTGCCSEVGEHSTRPDVTMLEAVPWRAGDSGDVRSSHYGCPWPGPTSCGFCRGLSCHWHRARGLPSVFAGGVAGSWESVSFSAPVHIGSEHVSFNRRLRSILPSQVSRTPYPNNDYGRVLGRFWSINDAAFQRRFGNLHVVAIGTFSEYHSLASAGFDGCPTSPIL